MRRQSGEAESQSRLGFIACVAPALAFVAVQLIGRVAAGTPDLAGVLEDLAVRLVPGSVFSWVLDHLLFLAKPLLYSVLLAAEVAALALAAASAPVRRQPVAAGAGLVLVGAITGLLGSPTSAARAPGYYLTLAAAAAAYAVFLAGASGRAGPASVPAAPSRRMRRRDLLVAGVGALTTLVLGDRVVGPLMVPAFLRARQASGAARTGSGPWADMPSLVTSPATFYVVSKNIRNPAVDVATWHLRVHGLVERPLTLAYADILALPSVEADRTLECISNPVGGNLISTGRFTGIRLGDLLDRAGVQARAALLRFTSADAYFETMTLQQAHSPLTLLAYGLDGRPLAPEHGFPLRVLGSGTYGMKNPKWLTDIELVAAASPAGFWEQTGWSADGGVFTMSEINVPAADAQLPAGAPVAIGGVAFAGDRGVTRVELSPDGGQTWHEARLQGSLGPSTWVLWEYLWQSPAPGAYSLVVRATDGTGATQPRAVLRPFPYGAMGRHSIHVRVG